MTYEYGDIRVLQRSDVASPDEYGAFLADHLPVGDGPALDLTTGSGFHALVLFRQGFSVTAVDVSSAAVKAAKANSVLNGANINVLRGDLYRPVAGQRFEVIVAWPPVMPTARTDKPYSLHSQINDGGMTGFDVVERVLKGAPEALAPAGRLLSIRPWYLNKSRYEQLAREAGLRLRTLATERFPIGAVSSERLPSLCRLSGHTEEEIHIKGQEMHVVEFTALVEGSPDGA